MLNTAITRTQTGNSSSPSRTLADDALPGALKLPQRRSNRMAWLVVEGQTQGFHCSLRELSEKSAHLTVSGLMGIPDTFSLYVEPDSIKFDCQVTMRKGNSVRVDFTDCTANMRYRDLASRR